MADNRNSGWRGQRGWGENSGARGSAGDQRFDNGSYDDAGFGPEPAVDYNDSRSLGGYGREHDRYAGGRGQGGGGRGGRGQGGGDDRDYLTSGLRAGGQSDRPEDYAGYGGRDPRGSDYAGEHYRSSRRAYNDASSPYGPRGEQRAGGYGGGYRGAEDRSFNAGHNQYLEAVTDGDDSPGEHRGRGPKGYKRSDDRIREDINDRLTEDGRLDATHIEVSVADGEVTLSGMVDSREAKRRAEDLADHVSGVHHVQNNLRINRGGDLNDQTAASSGGSTSAI